MNKILSAVVFTAIFAACAFAGPPVSGMTPYSIGAEYSGSLTGHKALYEFDSSSVATHLFRLSYSPVKYLRFSAGIGGSSPYADPEIKGTAAKLSAGGGVALYWPKPLPFLSLTAGYDGLYLKYGEGDSTFALKRPALDEDGRPLGDTIAYVTLAKDGRATGALHTPYFGIVFHACRYVDIELGGQLYYFDVEKRVTVRNFEFDEESGEAVAVGTNRRTVAETVSAPRVYAALTLRDEGSGAYLTAGGSVSPDIMNEETKKLSKLTAASLWLNIGIVLTDRTKAYGRKKAEFSQSYIELKEIERNVAEELSQEIDLEEETGKKDK
jgi:hypothetical protein